MEGELKIIHVLITVMDTHIGSSWREYLDDHNVPRRAILTGKNVLEMTKQ